MHKLSKIALLAIAGSLSLYTPAMAQPAPSGRIDCTLPENANNPFCLQQPNTRHRGGTSNNDNGGYNGPRVNAGPQGGGTSGGQTQSQTQTQTNNNGPSGSNSGGTYQGPRGFDFSRRDRDTFHQRFRGFNFGVFPTPSFSIRLGVRVPHSYALKPVPRSIYRYYPQFRGYLFFVTRNGSIVIVSPRSLRIVAVL